MGARVWKTVIALFASMLLDSLRPGSLPFYAGIAAIWCIRPSIEDSLEGAANREIATLFGGAAGMVFLFFANLFGGIPNQTLAYALIALCLVPIISVSVFIGRERTTFLMCVVFLSVAVAHGQDVHPFMFALNRILDTTIGIGVALVTNMTPTWIRRLRDRKHREEEQAPEEE